MGWREDLQLRDIQPDTEIEVVCRKCGKHRYEWARDMITISGDDEHAHNTGTLFVSELQAALVCYDRFCAGAVKVAIMHDHLEEGFVGGMP